MQKHFSFILSFLFFVSIASVFGQFEEAARNAKQLQVVPGIVYKQFTMTAPRPLNIAIARIDLKNPHIFFKSTGRDELWGQPMPDYETMIVRTKRQSPLAFMKQARKSTSEGGLGVNMVLAFNTNAWRPWVAPFTHKYAGEMNLLVSDGDIVCEGDGRVAFQIFKDGHITIDKAPRENYAELAFAFCSWGPEYILCNGEPQKCGNDLAPRTCVGLSSDRRYMYVMTVDGRQKGFSEGASETELGQWLMIAGASDGINVDGGGSTAMVIWNQEEEKYVRLNNNGGQYYRPVASSFGICIKPESVK